MEETEKIHNQNMETGSTENMQDNVEVKICNNSAETNSAIKLTSDEDNNVQNTEEISETWVQVLSTNREITTNNIGVKSNADSIKMQPTIEKGMESKSDNLKINNVDTTIDNSENNKVLFENIDPPVQNTKDIETFVELVPNSFKEISANTEIALKSHADSIENLPIDEKEIECKSDNFEINNVDTTIDNSENNKVLFENIDPPVQNTKDVETFVELVPNSFKEISANTEIAVKSHADSIESLPIVEKEIECKSDNLQINNVNTDTEVMQNINIISQNIELPGNEDSNDSDSNALRFKKLSSRKKLIVIDSDSEDEFNFSRNVESNRASNDEESDNNVPVKNDVQKKKIRICNLEDEDSDSLNNEQRDDKNVDASEDNLLAIQRACLSKLCDSESSEDESDHHNAEDDNVPERQKIMKSNKNRNKERTPNQMTRKDAIEQRRQIKSESQRMLRESHVTLPYHRPKSHTLDEFLKRRPRLANGIKAPPNTPTAFGLKMSSEQLAITAKLLAEREKEIEKFYNSASESDENEPEQVETKSTETNNNTGQDSATQENLQENQIAEDDGENKDENKCEYDNANKDAIKSALDEYVDNIIKSYSSEKDESIPLDNEESNNTKSNDEFNEQNEIIDCHHIESVNTDINSSENINKEINSTDDITKIDDEEMKVENNDQTCLNDEKNAKTNENYGNNDETSTNDKNDVMETNNETKRDIDDILLKYKSESQNVDIPKTWNKINLEEKLKKLNPIFSLKSNFQPRLRGDPNDVIILDETDSKNSKEVDNMIKRYLAHTTKKVHHKKREVSVLNVHDGVLHQEIIDLTYDDDDEPVVVMQKPGAKLKKLREELEEQISKKRLEDWKKRQEEKELQKKDVTYEGEKDECVMNLDNEEEEEMTDSGTSSEEDEEEEIDLPEKPRVKSAFVDDEAEESDEEIEATNDDVENVDDEDEVDDEDGEEDDAEDEDDADDEDDDPDENQALGEKKTLRRIIAASDSDDSADETDLPSKLPEENSEADISNADDAKIVQDIEKKLDSWEDNDDEIPLYQPRRESLEKTPYRPSVESRSDFDFLTPTIQLTALQGMDTEPKPLEESPRIPLPPEPSPLKSHPGVVTRLFTDINVNSEKYFDELEDLCSGKFTGCANENAYENASTRSTSVADICADAFISITQFSDDEKTETPDQVGSLLLNDIIENSQEISPKKNTEKCNIPDVHENEEKSDEIHVSTTKKFVIISSDEEMDIRYFTEKKKNKKKRKRYVIDDVSFSDEEEEETNDIRLDNSDNDDAENETERNVDYDSEENEIEIDDTEVVSKANDFFENEAELSESEWGSADEDEKDLDQFEMEDGDEETFNEKKIQRELERIHVRQVLDEDKREVRMLQELLLEDGELHGEGREKKFKWKNADSLAWKDTDTPKDEEDEDGDDIESELQWRKLRHEREIYLEEERKKLREKGEDDLLPLDCKILKFGEAALQRSLSSTQSQEKIPATQSQAIPPSPSSKLPFTLLNQRGSFLARSEKTLTRIAEMTKLTSNQFNNGPKNSKNFVFTSVAKTETNKKRKAEEGTPKILKKLRIADMSPNVQHVKPKASAKSLFNGL